MKYKKDIKAVIFNALLMAGGFIVGSSIVRSIARGELTLRDDNLWVFVGALVLSLVLQLRKNAKQRQVSE